MTDPTCPSCRALSEENKRLRERLEYDPGGSDKIDELEQAVLFLRSDVDNYKKWVIDLQANCFVNCVYCGLRYGRDSETPVVMADVLYEHIKQCPKHPLSEALRKLSLHEKFLNAVQQHIRGFSTRQSSIEGFVSAVACGVRALNSRLIDICRICGEHYSMPPTARARLCSNGFHKCRDCLWVDGARIARCARCAPEEVPTKEPACSGGCGCAATLCCCNQEEARTVEHCRHCGNEWVCPECDGRATKETTDDQAST